jgi:hypothetical protein
MSVRISLCVVALLLAGGSAGAQTAGGPAPQPKAKKAITLNEAFLRLRLAGIEVEKAHVNLDQAQERAAWAARMVKLGYMAPSQATAERVKAAEAHIAYLKARANLDALLCGRKPNQ